MKILFLKKIILLALPIVLVFLLPIMTIWWGREYYSVMDVLKTQELHPETLFYMAESGHVILYKNILVSSRNPEVLALGTSRVMSFREQFFSKGAKFTNASNSVSSFFDMKSFLEKLPENNIKLIILSIDQEMFKPSHPTIVEKDEPEALFTRFSQVLVDSWLQIYKQYFSGKFGLVQLKEQSDKSRNIGLNALVNGIGFRFDGSLNKNLESESNHVERIENDIQIKQEELKVNRASFLYGTEPPTEEMLSTFRDFLEYCKERGIYVVGFVPPYPHALYEEMIKVDDDYSRQVVELPMLTRSIFSKYNFPVFDFSDISTVGGKDTEFADITHGTDKLYLRTLIYMASRDNRLASYVDTVYLKKLLGQTFRDFLSN